MHYVGPGILASIYGLIFLINLVSVVSTAEWNSKNFLILLTQGIKPCIIRKKFPASTTSVEQN